MKVSIKTLAVAAVLFTPIFAVAQSQGQVTRASVRAELAQLESVGYQPSAVDPFYPNNLQVAQAKLASESNMESVGGSPSGASQAGHPAISQADWDAMYTR